MSKKTILAKIVDSAILTRNLFYYAGVVCLVFGIGVYTYAFLHTDSMAEKAAEKSAQNPKEESIEIEIEKIIKIQGNFVLPGGILILVGAVLLITGNLVTKKIKIVRKGKPTLVIYMSRSHEPADRKIIEKEVVDLADAAMEGRLEKFDSKTFGE